MKLRNFIFYTAFIVNVQDCKLQRVCSFNYQDIIIKWSVSATNKTKLASAGWKIKQNYINDGILNNIELQQENYWSKQLQSVSDFLLDEKVTHPDGKFRDRRWKAAEEEDIPVVQWAPNIEQVQRQYYDAGKVTQHSWTTVLWNMQ